MFYKVSARAARESTAALHPRSRAPRTPARRYGPDVVNELVHIRKQLKADGWDYGPRSIHYAAAMEERFPGERVPSVATIGRLLSAVGQVDPAPKKRPKSSHIPLVRATAMALWQLDAFEYRLADGQTGRRARSIRCSMMRPATTSAPGHTRLERIVPTPCQRRANSDPYVTGEF